jgi:hypothetical protein
MNNLHTTSDVSRFIGALELGGDIGGANDGGLEFIGSRITAGPTTGCPLPPTVICRHIDDDALETVGKAVTAAPTHLDPITRRCL